MFGCKTKQLAFMMISKLFWGTKKSFQECNKGTTFFLSRIIVSSWHDAASAISFFPRSLTRNFLNYCHVPQHLWALPANPVSCMFRNTIKSQFMAPWNEILWLTEQITTENHRSFRIVGGWARGRQQHTGKNLRLETSKSIIRCFPTATTLGMENG